jgi:hypothetical protein
MLGDPHVVGGMALLIFKGAVLFPLAFAFLSVQLPGPGVVKGLSYTCAPGSLRCHGF